MPVNPRSRIAVICVTIAIVAPVAVAIGWKNYNPLFQALPGYIGLIVVSLTARFLGFRAAIASTLSFAIVLAFYILPTAFPDRPIPFLLIRLVLFFIAASTVASLSHQTASQVHDAEERYRLLVDTAPDGIAICNARAEILSTNPALVQLVGAAGSDVLVGRRLIDLACPESANRLEKAIAELRATGRLWSIDMRWMRLDGHAIDVEIAGVCIHREGEPILQLFVRDLTARRSAETSLEATALRMAALFNAALDTIVWVDASGRCVDANAAASKLLGYTHEEILSKQLSDFSGNRDSLQRLWSGGGGRGECTIIRKDGEARELAYALVMDVLPGFHCAFLHDITARKEAERAVQRLSAHLLQLQDEERRRIARQLHDTTAQNLAAIRLNLAIVRRSLDAANAKMLESVDESIALTDESIGEVRTLAYLLHPPMIEEAGLLVSLRWFAQGFEARSGIRVTLDFPEALSRLPLEMETAIFRIVQEGLNNIQRHSGSTVARISIERPPNVLRLQIEDKGRGLPLHLRGNDAVTAGAGVGLASIRERVREFGGAMSVQSDDDGTVLSVTLPLSED
ncbi:MAG: hypothetical protein QOI24_2403 [Acidobacteriota bacterium]|jgi:PAS domain S-box-containing protein|nr:hypothetical protein [Acidobacteriota bacterium]